MLKCTDTAALAGSLRDARAAQLAAHGDAALELLAGCEDWPEPYAEQAILIKADVLGRRSPSDGLAYLAGVEDLFASAAGRFARDVETGKLHAAVRDYAAAESRYADARARCGAVPDGAHTMAYHDLRMRWFRRECDPAAPEVALALAHPDPSIASAAYAYRAWLHAGNGDYAAHVADLTRAVGYATHAAPVDVAVLASSVHALAQVAFETADAGGMAAAKLAAGALAWSPDVRVSHFMTVRAFGWDAFMRGNPGQAQWAFKEARGLAPSATWRIMGHLDRAFVARMSRNEFWALEELAQADALAFDVRWESSYGEDRQVLVALAVLHAATDVPRAQRYAAMYSRMGTESVNPALAVHGDPRALAHAKYAHGRIDQTLGRRGAATASLEAAYAIYDGSAFHFRATLSATALAELTGEERWRRRRAGARRPLSRLPAGRGGGARGGARAGHAGGPLAAAAPDRAGALERGRTARALAPLQPQPVPHRAPDRGGLRRLRRRLAQRAPRRGPAARPGMTAVLLAALALVLLGGGVAAAAVRAVLRARAEAAAARGTAAHAVEQRYNVLEAMHEGLYILDAEYRITHINEEAERLLRTTADEVVGAALETIVDPLASELLPDVRAAGRSGIAIERVHAFPGRQTWIEVRIVPAAARPSSRSRTSARRPSPSRSCTRTRTACSSSPTTSTRCSGPPAATGASTPSRAARSRTSGSRPPTCCTSPARSWSPSTSSRTSSPAARHGSSRRTASAGCATTSSRSPTASAT